MRYCFGNTTIGGYGLSVWGVCLTSIRRRNDRMGNHPIRTTIQSWRSHTQSAEHALDLLAVFSRMVNSCDHNNPRLDEVSIILNFRLQGLAGLVACQCQQP